MASCSASSGKSLKIRVLRPTPSHSPAKIIDKASTLPAPATPASQGPRDRCASPPWPPAASPCASWPTAPRKIPPFANSSSSKGIPPAAPPNKGATAATKPSSPPCAQAHQCGESADRQGPQHKKSAPSSPPHLFGTGIGDHEGDGAFRCDQGPLTHRVIHHVCTPMSDGARQMDVSTLDPHLPYRQMRGPASTAGLRLYSPKPPLIAKSSGEARAICSTNDELSQPHHSSKLGS